MPAKRLTKRHSAAEAARTLRAESQSAELADVIAALEDAGPWAREVAQSLTAGNERLQDLSDRTLRIVADIRGKAAGRRNSKAYDAAAQPLCAYCLAGAGAAGCAGVLPGE